MKASIPGEKTSGIGALRRTELLFELVELLFLLFQLFLKRFKVLLLLANHHFKFAAPLVENHQSSFQHEGFVLYDRASGRDAGHLPKGNGGEGGQHNGSREGPENRVSSFHIPFNVGPQICVPHVFRVESGAYAGLLIERLSRSFPLQECGSHHRKLSGEVAQERRLLHHL